MSAETLAAEAVASRLERQEEDIRWLWAEVQRLRDEQLNAPYSCQAEGPCLTREVAQLRAENRDLRHRLCRLRLCLAEELSRQATLESAELAGAQEAGAQVSGQWGLGRTRAGRAEVVRAERFSTPGTGAGAPRGRASPVPCGWPALSCCVLLCGGLGSRWISSVARLTKCC